MLVYSYSIGKVSFYIFIIVTANTDFCQLCKESSGAASTWVGCDLCWCWFHWKCVGFSRLPVNSLTTRVADLQLFYNQYIMREKCTNIVYIYETYIVEVF